MKFQGDAVGAFRIAPKENEAAVLLKSIVIDGQVHFITPELPLLPGDYLELKLARPTPLSIVWQEEPVVNLPPPKVQEFP